MSSARFFEAFVVSDPTGILPEEVKIAMDATTLSFLPAAASEPNSQHSWEWCQQIVFTKLPGSDDPEDMDDLQVMVPDQVKYLFECDDAAPLVDQAKVFLLDNKAANRKQRHNIEDNTKDDDDGNNADGENETMVDDVDFSTEPDRTSAGDGFDDTKSTHMETARRRRTGREEWLEGKQQRLESIESETRRPLKHRNQEVWLDGLAARLDAIEGDISEDEFEELGEFFDLDDKVEVEVEGENVPGRIIKVHSDGTYKIECDDGKELR
jgi:hypothetical protein